MERSHYPMRLFQDQGLSNKPGLLTVYNRSDRWRNCLHERGFWKMSPSFVASPKVLEEKLEPHYKLQNALMTPIQYRY